MVVRDLNLPITLVSCLMCEIVLLKNIWDSGGRESFVYMLIDQLFMVAVLLPGTCLCCFFKLTRKGQFFKFFCILNLENFILKKQKKPSTDPLTSIQAPWVFVYFTSSVHTIIRSHIWYGCASMPPCDSSWLSHCITFLLSTCTCRSINNARLWVISRLDKVLGKQLTPWVFFCINVYLPQ